MAPRAWCGTIKGEPVSKANSRRLVSIHGQPRVIKSAKALDYVRRVELLVPRLNPMLEGRLRLTATIYYASERPDLDESLILDALQGRIYANDRQVRERHVWHAIDREDPRAILLVEEIAEPLFAAKRQKAGNAATAPLFAEGRA